MPYEQYEDNLRQRKQQVDGLNRTSPYCDLVYYESSRTPELRLAAHVVKPDRPSYLLVGTHGWHMSIPKFAPKESPDPNNHYLRLLVDMRGRAFSDGRADCNGWELYDVTDAVNYARKHYADYILDPDIVFFEAGSGGGGNALAIVGKFPDFFAAATALCGISDYALWHKNDEAGEFRDGMDVWIGCRPADNPMAYRSRSGLALAENLCTPLFLAHGENDIRVPAVHSRSYVDRAKALGKSELVRYYELKGEGTRSHWGNATEEQLKQVEVRSEENRLAHRRPVSIPSSGRLIVGGYLFTKHFFVVLDSIDKTAWLDYDLNKNTFRITCDVECDYKIERYGGWAMSAISIAL